MTCRENSNFKVYDDIFSIVEKRLAAHDLPSVCSRDAFLAVCGKVPGDFNPSDFNDLDNNSFADAVYLALWNRPPTPEEKRAWADDIATLSSVDFQCKFMKWVESMRKKARLDDPGSFAVFLNKAYNNVFLKMPEPFQKFIRDNFKKG